MKKGIGGLKKIDSSENLDTLGQPNYADPMAMLDLEPEKKKDDKNPPSITGKVEPEAKKLTDEVSKDKGRD